MLNSVPPQPGQLVDVRGRRFVVTDVRGTVLPTSFVVPQTKPVQHLVTVSSVEDDGRGEELQVIWEIEPGAVVFERPALPEPTGLDDPERLDAFLDAVKWGTASTADIRNIQSPFRSGVIIEDYQLDPVVRAIQMPRVNLLIADDVGLGKTIEAGLVCQELLLRHRIRRILIVCPSSLQIQWKEQMRDKFGLEFRIVDSNLMKELRRTRGIHVNPWTHFPRLITSIDYLKRERPLRLFREALPSEDEPRYPRRFDMLIVDEAHNVAPSGSGNYAVDSQRTAAIRLLVPHFEHKLFLTATPHNGYPESFTALLELLDAQRFARGVAPDPNQLRVIMVRRLKSEVTEWDGSPRFAKRVLEPLTVAYTPEERRVHTALNEYTRLRREGARNDGERYATEFVLKLLKKRLFSSPQAFATTLLQHEKSLAAAKTREPARPEMPAVGLLRRQFEQPLEEDFANDDQLEETTTDVVMGATRLFHELTTEESALLQEMKRWAEKATPVPDSKAKELIRWLREHIKPGGQWSNQRVLIFTEYRATQNWLYQILDNQGLADKGRLAMLYGGMDSKERERIKAAFQTHPDDSEVRILLATDAASEGLDLQNHCSRLVHTEIPWNPNRMEQRNGRIDRHGQKAPEVRIYHFVGAGFQETRDLSTVRPGDLDGDLEFLMRAAMKVNTIREDLGKVGPVIARQVEEAMLGTRSMLDTIRAERDSEPMRRLLKFERDLRKQIEKLTDQLNETRKSLRLSPENIESVVTIGLDLAGLPPLRPVAVENFGGKAFHLPALKGTWAACAEGLEHPHKHNIRPITFDQEAARGRDDVVLVHLNHQLVQRCLRLLRAEIGQGGDQKKLHRIAARVVPTVVLESPAVIAYGRLVVLGGDQQRLHEEIITAGGMIHEGRFKPMNIGKVAEALGSATPGNIPEHMTKRLLEMWPDFSDALLQGLEQRMKDRSASLMDTLQKRADREMADITLILNELKRSIEAELAEPEEPLQLELFSLTEKEQVERNLGSLRARVAQIPQEIVAETAAIQARFANPQSRLFPLAVLLLIPQKFAAGGRS